MKRIVLPFLAPLCAVAPALSPFAGAQVSEKTPGYFAFHIPPLDGSKSFADMSFLNPEPAGAAGFVAIRDGHFVDGRGQRLRLFGCNLCFEGCFPDKKDAPAIAAHLRKLGVNAIRLHHTDGGVSPRAFWLPDRSGFDPQQVDKFDWLIYQLKQNGIYSNINLHIGRNYPGASKDIPYAFRYCKGLDNFYRPFIEDQKKYARTLLTHRNPYTKTAYTDEPAVVCVEINNENALTGYSANALRQLPEPYLGDLTRQWNEWLKARYGDTKALRERWGREDEPMGGEMLANGDFARGADDWKQEASQGAQMKAEALADAAAPGGRALKLTTLAPGKEKWSLQFHQSGLKLAPNKLYTLSFQARADRPLSINVIARLASGTFKPVGLSEDINLEKDWRKYTFAFRSQAPEGENCRIGFNFQNQLGAFEFAAVSLRPGGAMSGIAEGQTLEAGNIPIPTSNASDEVSEDLKEFLARTEMEYVSEMIGFLKRKYGLGVKASVTDTQASYGGVWGARRESQLSDYLDNHAYWQHPRFPGKPWDTNNWTIGNTSMVADAKGGALAGRAWYRDIAKPYTLSEYNHPAPNDYGVEMFPMFASFAAFQDWDGVYAFTWQQSGGGYGANRIGNYFELCNHPGKAAFMPIAALMFRMGAVEAGRDPLVAVIPTGDLARQAVEHPGYVPASELATVALTRRVGFRLSDEKGPVRVPDVPPPTGKRVSDTGQIEWDVTDPKQAAYTINAPAIRLAMGTIGGRDIRLGDASIHVTGATNGWAAVAIGALDGKPLAESAKVLVVAAGRVENSNMGWNAERNSVGKNWGEPPIVCEGIQATIQLPAGDRIEALDGTGKPQGEVKSTRSGSGVEFQIGPEYKTLWYSVSVRPPERGQ